LYSNVQYLHFRILKIPLKWTWDKKMCLILFDHIAMGNGPFIDGLHI
jgi:hypothetical protein